jgi:XTP/dITP diphosphohydrolase
MSPEKKKWYFQGIINGIILSKIVGAPNNYLPYDTIFKPDGFNQTFSQMLEEEKNKISHRAQAFTKAKEFLIRLSASSADES